MLTETERAQLARHEAFLLLSSELIRLDDPALVGKLLGEQLKYVCSAFCWRYVGLDAAWSSRTGSSSNTPQLLCIEGLGDMVNVEVLERSALSPFEQEMWSLARAARLDASALDERITTLPSLLRNPEIGQLQVHPLWTEGGLEALFMVSSRRQLLDKLDLKFIGLTAQFVHRKLRHLRQERRMNDELLDTVNHLRRTQDDLIHSEKLAALGSMVAGISHELNTPIANARLMSTSLADSLRNFDALVSSQMLKRSDLLRWQGGALEMVQLLDRSVQRAATLLTSFKQVAVDQTSERRRVFDLRDGVEDVLATLRPGLKSTPWKLINEVPSGIECDSFPGPLGQIVTNLVQNAALHAFEGRSEGSIAVSASCRGAVLSLTVSDDGVGMNTATLAHIFEPFFTTKMGRGGTGLGLTVSHRIAATILGGELRVISSPGAGSRFILTMPPHTPRKL